MYLRQVSSLRSCGEPSTHVINHFCANTDLDFRSTPPICLRCASENAYNKAGLCTPSCQGLSGMQQRALSMTPSNARVPCHWHAFSLAAGP